MVNTIDNRKIAAQANKNSPPPNDDTLEKSPQYCEDTNDNEISSVACMPAQTYESPPTKKENILKDVAFVKRQKVILLATLVLRI